MSKRRKKSNSFWSSGAHKRRNSGTRKKSHEDDSGAGCLLVLLVVGLLVKGFEYIGKFFKRIIDEIRDTDFSGVKTILVLLIVGVVLIGIVVHIRKSKWAEEKRKKRAERRDCKACLRLAEIKQDRPRVSCSMEFSNKEEEEVNVAFRRFVLRIWELNRAKSHIEYLNSRYQAFLKLNREKETEETKNDLLRWVNALEEAMKNLPKAFSSIVCNKFYKLDEIKRNYNSLIESKINEKYISINDQLREYLSHLDIT